jgi:hypothetical protein
MKYGYDMSPAEASGAVETMRHKCRVSEFLGLFVMQVLSRASEHDNSKVGPEELTGFGEATARLKGLTYGSPEYEASAEDLKVLIKGHYSRNSHHVEHHENGINDFDLFDLVEMLADWKAATERHDDGDLGTSITKNAASKNITPQLKGILRNTAEFMGWL